MAYRIIKKYTCLIFGEGRRDKKFLIALTELEKFKFHTPNWTFSYGNGSGGSVEDILQSCHRETLGRAFDLVLCFIDLDKLKKDFPRKWKTKKVEIEKNAKNLGIDIIWNRDNAEDEYRKVLGNVGVRKHRLNEMARKQAGRFINSRLWKSILKSIKHKEQQLQE